jgi:UDP-glucose 6-dehydrogenase
MKISIIGTTYSGLAIGVGLANERNDVTFIDSLSKINDVDLHDVEYYNPNAHITLSADLEKANDSDIVLNATNYDLTNYYNNVVDIKNGDTINDDVFVLLNGVANLLK